MAPLSLFRGQGGSISSSSVDAPPVPPEPPRTPPPDALRRNSSGGGGGEPTASPSRLNPARLLRRKGSRSIRDGREGSQDGWLGGLGRSGHVQSQGLSSSASTSSLSDPRRVGHAQRQSGGSSRSGPPQPPPQPHPQSQQHPHPYPQPIPHPHAQQPQPPSIPSTTSSNPSRSRQGSVSSGSNTTAAPNGNASNFGSVRSLRSIRSEGTGSSPGDSEIILGPSPDHPLVKGEPNVVHHHPFLLSSQAPANNLRTPLSPPRRPARSPNPPPPPRAGARVASPPPPVPGIPSSISASSVVAPIPIRHYSSRSDPRHSNPSTPGEESPELGDSVHSEAPTITPSSHDDHHDPEAEEAWRADTAAWLARKPSGRRRPALASVTAGDRRLRRAESASSSSAAAGSPTMSASASASASGDSVDEPLTPTFNPRLAGQPVSSVTQQHHAPLSAVASPSPVRSTPQSCPPPHGQPIPYPQAQPISYPQSQPIPHPTSQPQAQPIPARPLTPERAGFVVSVQCLPASDDEVRWEVVLRRTASTGTEAPAPGGPVGLTPASEQSLHAPPFASSVNLSLALDTDAPSGKLVFITLPGATPTRLRPRSSSSSAPGAPGGVGGGVGPAASSGSSTFGGNSGLGASPRIVPATTRATPQTSTNPSPARDHPLSSQLTSAGSPPSSGALGSPAPVSARAPPSSEPISPRSAAYKRQGAVWASSAGAGVPGLGGIGGTSMGGLATPLAGTGQSPSSDEQDVFASTGRDLPAPPGVLALEGGRAPQSFSMSPPNGPTEA